MRFHPMVISQKPGNEMPCGPEEREQGRIIRIRGRETMAVTKVGGMRIEARTCIKVGGK